MKKVIFVLALSFLLCQNYAISSDKEMELKNLYDKIVDGLGNPADIDMYNSLLDSYQSENRKRVDYKDMFNFSLNTDIEYQSGYQSGMTFLGSSNCSELVTINYDCSKLPWDNKDVYKRISDYGEIYTRSCGVYDGCVNEGILVISNDYRTTPPNPPTFIYREDDRFSYEEKSVVKFRMRQVITEKIPRPTGEDFYPFGYVVLNDGNKTLMVIFGEMMDGAKLILIPVEAIVTGDDFVITKLIATEYNWSYWSEYKFTVDKGGEVGLFIDNSFIPTLSYPYSMIGFPAMTSGGVIAFGNGGRHYTSGWTDWDYFDYAVGENSVGGCVSENGWLKIDNIFLRKKIVVVGYENSEIFVSGKIKNIDGLGSNTQGHVFYLRLDREVRNIDGVSIREIRSEVRIGPIGIGKNPKSLIVEGVSGWDLKDKNGEYVREGIYTDKMNISIVRVDKKGKEKVLAEVKSVTNSIIIYYLFTNRVIKDLSAGTFGIFFDYYEAGGKNSLEPVSYYLRECSTGSDPILDILYDYDSTISTRFRKVKSNDDYNICRCEERPHGWPPRICRCENGSGVDIIPSYSGIIMGIVRAKWSDRAGSCKVERCRGGKCIILKESLYFDGKEIFWRWDREDGLQSVIKEENQDSMMILSDVADGYYGSGYQMLYTYGLPAIDDNSGTGAGSYIKADREKSWGILYVGLKPYIKGLKVLDIYRNDSWEDYDGDRLGMELERELKICDNKTDRFGEFRCSSVFNTKDTDGDGIEDYVEVMGCDRQCGDGVKLYPGCYGAEYNDSVCGGGKRLTKNKEFPQYLPLWGANPRRMDVFFEMDIECAQEKGNCGKKECNTGTKDKPECKEMKYMDNDSDGEIQLSKVAEKLKENSVYSHSSIVNPDGTVGVYAHFDRGYNCINKTLCGDWGGMNTYYFTKGCIYSDENFESIRRGLFHHIDLCEKSGGGSSSSGGWTLQFGRLNEFATTIHEIGHNLGVGDTPAKDVFTNGQPHWTGLNNYAYQDSFDGDGKNNVHFSDGRFMNYMLNPAGVCEYKPLGDVSLGYEFLSKSTQHFNVNGVYVDWNRDGYYNPDCSPDKLVKGYIHFIPNKDSAGLRYRMNLRLGLYIDGYGDEKYKSDGTPQLVTFHDVQGDENSSLYLFNNYNGKVYYRKLIGMNRNTNCSNDNRYSCKSCDYDRKGNCCCDEWGSIQQVNGVNVSTDTESAPALAEIKMENGNYRLYMVFRQGDNTLHYKYLENGVWSANYSLYDYTTKEASLVNYRGGLMLVYRAEESGRIRQRFMSNLGEWSNYTEAVDSNGNYIITEIAPSVAIRPMISYLWGDISIAHMIYAPFIPKPGQRPGHNMRVVWYNEGDGRWYSGINLVIGEPSMHTASKIEEYGVSKKVGFFWYPDNSINVQGGRFYIMYTSDQYNPQNGGGIVYYGFMSAHWEGNNLVWDFDMHSRQDNSWTKALTGVSMTYYKSNFPNQINIDGLVASYTQSDKTMRFLPYASGIYDFDLHDQNDWKYIEEYCCKSIRGVFSDSNSYCKTIIGLSPPPPLFDEY